MNAWKQSDGVSTRDDRSTVPDESTHRPTQDHRVLNDRPAVGASGRSRAELITLAGSTTIVVGLLAVIALLYLTGGSSEATIEAIPELERVEQRSGDYYLPLTITNRGDVTVEDVTVEVSLAPPSGTPETSDVTIDFLAGHATEDAVVVFSEDPEVGELTVDVVSYLSP